MSSDTPQPRDVGPSDSSLPELLAPQTVDELATEVLVLRTLIEDLTQGARPAGEGSEREPDAGGAAGDVAAQDVDEELQWAWRRADAAEAHLLWAKLGDWVAWLVERYELGGAVKSWSVPQCWWQHPVAVEELTALMAAWDSAYWPTPRAASEDLIAWHDRWLWACLDRLAVRAGWAGCKDSTGHQHASVQRWDDASGFQDHVAADVAGRRGVVGSENGSGEDVSQDETTTQGQTEPGAH